MIKKLIIVIFVLSLIGGVAYLAIIAENLDFESVCGDKKHPKYTKLCNNVGKDAHSKQSIVNLTDKNYGKILGVSWRNKGNMISSSRQKKKRRSKKNAHYYIIGTSGKDGVQFLRISTEIDPR